MRTISKAYSVGGSLVLTIPSNWVEFLELKVGDFVEWEVLNQKETGDVK